MKKSTCEKCVKAKKVEQTIRAGRQHTKNKNKQTKTAKGKIVVGVDTKRERERDARE
jgi:hypothetical protein